MIAIPMEHGLLLAAALFCIGLCGLLIRRNLLFMLMSIEIMMNAAALAFVVAGSRWLQADGQVMYIHAVKTSLGVFSVAGSGNIPGGCNFG